jgi:protein-S-isoprenylcysteine O-methyltransferase Ste14
MASSYAAWAARWRVPVGFALGAAYLVFSRPALRLLVAGALVALLGLLLRGYAAGCLDKNRSLAVNGPYAYTRNPLYLGSLIMGVGFALAGGSWALGLAFIAFFLLVYWPVMRCEAEFLRQQFGEDYTRYALAVPFLLPTGRHAPDTGERFRWALYRQNREYQAAAGWFTGIAFLVLKTLLP